MTPGKLTNAGKLTLGSYWSSRGDLYVGGPNFTLGGGGVVSVEGGRISPTIGSAGVTLTVADQTVEGYGDIERVSLVNRGTVRANAGTGNRLMLDLTGPYGEGGTPDNTFVNAGRFEADGSRLYLYAASATNGGTIVARNGGEVSISAPAFEQSPAGQIRAEGGTVYLFAPYVNTRADGVVTQGGGSIYFVDHPVINAGQTLVANDGKLTFSQAPVDNRGGTLRAQGTGAIRFTSTIDNRGGRIELLGKGTAVGSASYAPAVINNVDGVIELRDDARFTFGSNSAVTGGTLAASGNAAFETAGASLTDVHITGTLNAVSVRLGGTIRNDGEFRAQGSVVPLMGRVELTGGGTFTLAGGVIGLPPGTYGPQTFVNRSNTLIAKGGSIAVLENHALVRVDTSLTLGGVVNDAGGTLRVSPGGSMTVTVVTGSGVVDVQGGGTLTILGKSSIPTLRNAGSVVVTNTHGAAVVDDLSGGGDVYVHYFGELTVGNLDAGRLKLEWPATLTLRPTAAASTAPRAARVRGIEFVGPGVEKLDLTDRGIVVDYDASAASPMPTLTAKVAAASRYQYGAWSVGPITSSNAAADPTNLAVGIAEAAAALGLSETQTGVFLGREVDASTVLIRTTVLGDATLDGTVGFGDLLNLAKNYNSTAGTWFNGDFDYDGTVGFSDLLTLAKHYNGHLDAQAAAPFGAAFQAEVAAAVAQVPEPTSAALVLTSLLVAPLLRRRRRH